MSTVQLTFKNRDPNKTPKNCRNWIESASTGGIGEPWPILKNYSVRKVLLTFSFLLFQIAIPNPRTSHYTPLLPSMVAA